MSRAPFALVLTAVAVWLGTRADSASGCGVAPHFGERVSTATESALIVWDEKTKTEHFIRRAAFTSTSADFGFLVPTPGRPELDVAEEYLFGNLGALTAPRVEYRETVVEVEREFGMGCAGAARQAFPGAAAPAGLADKAPGPKAGAVEVLAQKRVGDYDATVLAFRRGDESAAAGAAELTKWLAKHGYASAPPLTKWLERYVQNEWCVTAFKIATDAKQPAVPGRYHVEAKPVRMSFKAERPFYPYREPEAEAPAGGPAPRELRVFLAAQARFEGKLGDGAKAWPGQTVWSGPLVPALMGGVFADAKLIPAPAAEGWWLTEFQDTSSPRPGTDEVYFERSADQSPVERPPHVITTRREVVVTPWWHGAVYAGGLAALALGGVVLWRVLRK